MPLPPDPIGTTTRSSLLQGLKTTGGERHLHLLALSQRNIQAAMRKVSCLPAWSLDAPVILIGGWPDPRARTVRTGDLLHLLPFDAITCGAAMGAWQKKPHDTKSPTRRPAGPEPARFDCSRLLALLQESHDGFSQSPRELLVILFKEPGGGQPQLTSLRLSCGTNEAIYSSNLTHCSIVPHATASAKPFVISL
jgi:hypothetical protein